MDVLDDEERVGCIPSINSWSWEENSFEEDVKHLVKLGLFIVVLTLVIFGITAGSTHVLAMAFFPPKNGSYASEVREAEVTAP